MGGIHCICISHSEKDDKLHEFPTSKEGQPAEKELNYDIAKEDHSAAEPNKFIENESSNVNADNKPDENASGKLSSINIGDINSSSGKGNIKHMSSNSIGKKQIAQKNPQSPKPPLEVIKEINGELSKESYGENQERRITQNMQLEEQYKEMKQEAIQILDEKEKLIEQINSAGIDARAIVINKQSQRNGIKLSSRDAKPKCEVSANESSSRDDVCNKINKSEKENFANKSNDQIDSFNKEKGEREASSSKKRANVEKWREIAITSIIPEKKLMYAEDNDILLQGEFWKFCRENENFKGRQMFSSKFLVLTRSELRAKEVLLRMQNPLNKISLCNITEIDRINIQFKPKKSNTVQYFSFFVEFITSSTIDPTRIEEMKTAKSPKFDTSLSKIANDSTSKNKTSNIFELSDVKKDEDKTLKAPKENSTHNDSLTIDKKKAKKITLIASFSGEESPKRHEQQIRLDNDLIMNNNKDKFIFSSDSEEQVNKWVCVINYFINK